MLGAKRLRKSRVLNAFKKTKRTRRALKSRMRMRKQGIERLSVTRSGRHIYAQVISADGAKVLLRLRH